MKALLSLILVFSLSAASLAAPLTQAPTKLIERDLWRVRVDKLTNNILLDSAKKDPLDRALLLAHLSNLWWESEPTQSNSWIEKAVDTIAFYPSEDVKRQRAKFFSVIRQVLRLISMHNNKQSSRLVELIGKSDGVPEQDSLLNAEALVEQALRIVKTNPPQAMRLGVQSFALGFPTNADRLSVELRKYNSDLSDQFFRVALSSTAAAPDTMKLSRMQSIAFPYGEPPDFPMNLRPPAQLKILFLNMVADFLYQQQLRVISKAIPQCSAEAVLALRLKPQFSELLPQKSQMVNQAIERCLPGQPQEAKQVFESYDAKTTNIDELLKQADGIQSNPTVRARYLLRAALSAHQQKKYSQSVQILEKMNEEERKLDVELWEQLRFESGAGLAASQFKDGDVTGATKTLRAIPDAVRPLAQTTFVAQFPPDDLACSQYCVDTLNEARRGMVKSDSPFPNNSRYWLLITKLYSNYKLYTEAADTFGEMVTAFNGAIRGDQQVRDESSNKLIADCKAIITGFSLALFEMNESSIFESIGRLNDEGVRTEINLQLLKVMLQRYRTLKIEVEKERETTNQANKQKHQ